MIKTYEGYFQEDGQFVADSQIIQLPIRRKIIVNILEEDVIEEFNAKQKKQLTAIERLIAANNEIDDEPLDHELDAILNNRVNIKRVIAL